MVSHIYGEKNIIERNDRPNLFIKELGLYLAYVENLFNKYKQLINNKEEQYISSVTSNLINGITY